MNSRDRNFNKFKDRYFLIIAIFVTEAVSNIIARKSETAVDDLEAEAPDIQQSYLFMLNETLRRELSGGRNGN